MYIYLPLLNRLPNIPYSMSISCVTVWNHTIHLPNKNLKQTARFSESHLNFSQCKNFVIPYFFPKICKDHSSVYSLIVGLTHDWWIAHSVVLLTHTYLGCMGSSHTNGMLAKISSGWKSVWLSSAGWQWFHRIFDCHLLGGSGFTEYLTVICWVAVVSQNIWLSSAGWQ